MISEKLRQRPLFTWREDRQLGSEEQMLIDRATRKLVLLMKALEAHGSADRATIEEAALQGLEKAEYMYYALSEHEIMMAVEMEGRNEKSRSKARRSGDNEGFGPVEYGLR